MQAGAALQACSPGQGSQAGGSVLGSKAGQSRMAPMPTGSAQIPSEASKAPKFRHPCSLQQHSRQVLQYSQRSSSIMHLRLQLVKGWLVVRWENEMDQNGRIFLSMPYNQLPNSRQPSAAISSSTASAGSGQSWSARRKPDHEWSRGPDWRGPAIAPSGRCSVEAPEAWMRA